MNKEDMELIARKKCAELGIEYDDSVNRCIEKGKPLSSDVSPDAISLYDEIVRKMDAAIRGESE